MELPSLNAPLQLWWLGVVLPLVWWLAQPPRPRQVLWTAHRTQWRLAEALQKRRPPRFRALRWLLLSLAAVALAFAAADPVLERGNGPVRLLVLLDATASMAARSSPTEPSPFDRAVAVVREAGRAVPAHVEFDVALVRDGAVERLSGPAARALAQPGTPRGASPSRLADLVVAASSPDTVVFLVTDGQGPRSKVPKEGACALVGGVRDNAGLADVQIEDRWPLGDLVLRARLVAFASSAQRGSLRIDGAVQQPFATTYELQPDRPVEVEIPLVRTADGGRLVVAWQGEGDALALDDQRAFVLPPLPRTRMVWQEDDEGPGYAKKAALALAEVTGGTATEGRAGEAAGFLLVEGGRGVLPADGGPVLAFGLAGDEAVAWPAPVVVDWDRADPLLRDLDLSELDVAVALRDALPPGKALVTAELPDGSTAPLAVLVEGRRGNALHFAFRLQDSNLPLLPAFPQLLLRAYERTQPGDHRIAAEPVPCPLEESDLRVVDTSEDRPLPSFADPARELAVVCVWCALVLLALRCGVR